MAAAKYYNKSINMSSWNIQGSIGVLYAPQWDGTPSRARTVDTLIKSQVLYQLS